MRVDTAEKRSFQAATELAALDLSTWVRERLRASARKELTKTGQSVLFLEPSKNKQD